MWGSPQGTVALTPLQDVWQFRREVLQSKQPVIVDFYKDSCPTCDIQDAVLEQLAYEYRGRVKFVKFKIREAYMVSSCPEFMDEYNLFWVPTTVLFVNGREQRRWELNHLASEFRPSLDAACRPNGAAGAAGTAVAQTRTPAFVPPTAGNVCVEGQGCAIERPPRTTTRPAAVGSSGRLPFP